MLIATVAAERGFEVFDMIAPSRDASTVLPKVLPRLIGVAEEVAIGTIGDERMLSSIKARV